MDCSRGQNKAAVEKRRPLVDLPAPPKLWRKNGMLMQLLGVEGSKKSVHVLLANDVKMKNCNLKHN